MERSFATIFLVAALLSSHCIFDTSGVAAGDAAYGDTNCIESGACPRQDYQVDILPDKSKFDSDLLMADGPRPEGPKPDTLPPDGPKPDGYNPCKPINPCKNGGTCKNVAGKAVCTCVGYWEPTTMCASCKEGYAGSTCNACDTCYTGYPNCTMVEPKIENFKHVCNQACYITLNTTALNFDLTCATSYYFTLTKVLGCATSNGSVSPATGTLTLSDKPTSMPSATYNFGNCAPSTIRATLTATNKKKSKVAFIEIDLKN